MTPNTPRLNLDVSDLKVCYETIRLVADSLALEAHDFAASRGVPHGPVEAYLGCVHNALSSNLSDLIKTGPVVASGATGIAVSVAFDPVAYRAIAQAAQDCMAGGIPSV